MRRFLLLVSLLFTAACATDPAQDRREITSVVIHTEYGDYSPLVYEWRLEGRRLTAGHVRPSRVGSSTSLDVDYEAQLEPYEARAITDAARRIPLSSEPRISWVTWHDRGDVIMLSGSHECTVRIVADGQTLSLSSERPIAEFIPLVEAMDRCLARPCQMRWKALSTGYTLPLILPRTTPEVAATPAKP